MNGWFPDPGGEPGRYRYWDGSTWSSSTSDDPRDGPPDPGTAADTGGGVRSRIGLVIGVVALAVIVVVAAIVLGGGDNGVRPTTDDPLPTSSVSGGDDRSPTPSPSASESEDQPCPIGDPNARVVHPQDGRVYGGNLSFAAEPTFDDADNEPRFTFAYDVTQQVYVVQKTPGWIAQLAVGQVRAADGFGPSTAEAAETVVQCAVTSRLYQPYGGTRRDLAKKRIIVDGQTAYLIESEVRVDVRGLPFRGDHTIFILVPDGRNWGVFFGAVPIGNEQLDAVLDQAVRSLRVG